MAGVDSIKTALSYSRDTRAVPCRTAYLCQVQRNRCLVGNTHEGSPDEIAKVLPGNRRGNSWHPVGLALGFPGFPILPAHRMGTELCFIQDMEEDHIVPTVT